MKKPKSKLKFKKCSNDESYTYDFCCIYKCQAISELIDATFKYSKKELPLCSKHWLRLTGEK